MLTQPHSRNLGDYLTVKEAAEFLGVSPWTLRNWDRAGKVKAARHPVNGYRLYRRETLEGILEKVAGAACPAPEARP
jgi:MerR family transcriptional regulator, copper efflux regulator